MNHLVNDVISPAPVMNYRMYDNYRVDHVMSLPVVNDMVMNHSLGRSDHWRYDQG